MSTVLLLGCICVLFLLFSALRLKSTAAIRRGYQQRSARQLTGAAFARSLLDSEGISEVRVELTEETLGDYYDFKDDVIRLSEETFYGASLSAHGVAAHEVAHALQFRKNPLLVKCSSLLFSLGALLFCLSWAILFLAALYWDSRFVLLASGIVLIALVSKLQNFYLVEQVANRRALRLIVLHGDHSREEMQKIAAILRAASCSYFDGGFLTLFSLLPVRIWESLSVQDSA